MANARAVIDIDINTSPAAAGLRDLQAQINGFTTALNRANTEQGLAAKGITRQLSDLVNASRFFTAETIKMQTSAAQLDNTLKKGQVSMGQFFSARFRKDGLAAAQVMSLANARASALQTQFIQTGAAANGMKEALAIRPLQAFNSSTVVSAQKLAIHRAMLQQATTSMINFGKNTQWAGRQLMVGFTVPLTIFAGIAGKTFRDLEKEAVNFRKVYGDAFTPPAEMEANLKAVQELAKEYTKYGIAVRDTVGLAAQAAAAGAQNADLIDATRQATRLATLGQMEQNQALETTISLQSAFKLSGDELAKSINFLNMVENQTVVTLQDLSAAIPRVAPVIKGLGGSVEDLAVMLAALQEGGVTAEQGANALKSGLASLINPTDRAVEKLQGMGVALNSIVTANRGDLMGTVQDFARALSALDTFTRQQALETVFGKFQYARLGALFDNIIKDGSQASRVLQITTMNTAEMAASAEKELGAIEQSVGTKFVAAMERVKLAIAPIGEMFTKMAIPVINFFAKIIEKFNDLPDFAKNFIGLGTVITGIVIPAGTMFLGLLMNLIGTLVKFGSLVGIAFKGFTSGGFKGAFDAVSQAVKYMSLQEIDASLAAQQLRGSTEAVNAALLEQVGTSEAATAGIAGLAGAYEILVANMREAVALGGLPMAVPGAAMRTAGRGGASNLVGRPLPIVARNKGGSIPYLSDGGRPTVPGVGNRDTVPAMLTPGEFVVNKKATQQNMGLLSAINSGQIQYRNKGGGIAEMGRKFYGVRPNALSAAAMQAQARLAEFESSRGAIAGVFGLPASGPTAARRTQFTRISSGKQSSDIYQALQAKSTKGSDLLRQAVALGMKPEDLGLKAVGNLVLDMSKSTNSKMAFGTLSRQQLFKELTGKEVYAPLASQIQRYFGKGFDDVLFQSIYKDEISKLPAQGITNQRFEKATRNALRRYLDSAKDQSGALSYTKIQRKSFLRDILQGDTVRANVTVGEIRSLLNRNRIPFKEDGGDIKAIINGKEYNFGDLAGRSIDNLGRVPGIQRYDKIPIREGKDMARVHANKGGMIPGVQYLFGGARVAAMSASSIRQMMSGITTKARSAPSQFRTLKSKLGTEIDQRILMDAQRLGGFQGKPTMPSWYSRIATAHVNPEKRNGLKLWRANNIRFTSAAENHILNQLFANASKQKMSLIEDVARKNNLARFYQSIKNGKHPTTPSEYKNLDILITALRRDKRFASVFNGRFDDADTALLSGLAKFRYDKSKKTSKYTSQYDDPFNLITGKAQTAKDIITKMNKGGMVPGVQNFIRGGVAQRLRQAVMGPKPITNPQQQAAIEAQLTNWIDMKMKRTNVRELGRILGTRQSDTELFRGITMRPSNSGFENRFPKETQDALYRFARSGNPDDIAHLIGQPIAISPRSFSKSRKVAETFGREPVSVGDPTKDRAPLILKLKNEEGIFGFSPTQRVGTAKQSGKFVKEKRFYSRGKQNEKEIVPVGDPRLGDRRDVVVGRWGFDGKDIFIDTGAKLSRREVARATRELDAFKSSRFTPREQIRETQLELQRLEVAVQRAKRNQGRTSSKEFGDIAARLMAQADKNQLLRGGTRKDKSAINRMSTSTSSMLEEVSRMFNQARAVGLNMGGFISPTLKANQGNIVPGVGNKDTVPAMLTPGEFVINKKATMDNLGLLHAINSGQMKGYQEGGVVAGAGQMTGDGKVWYVQDERGNLKEFNNQRSAERYAKQVKKTVAKQQMTGRGGGMMRGMGASMGLGMGGMGVMMIGQQMQSSAAQKGETSAMGGFLSNAGILMSVASVLPFMGKFGIAIAAATAVIAPFALAIKAWRNSVDEASRKAAEFGANIGGTANALNTIAGVLGEQTPAQRQAQLQMGFGEGEQEKFVAEFSAVFETDSGRKFIEDLEKATSSDRFIKLSSYLQNAIAAGMMDKDQAQNFAKAVGAMLSDPTLGAKTATSIREQDTGADALTEIARQREQEVAASSAIAAAKRDETISYQQSSQVIGSSLQVIQDYANAQALAYEEFASGTLNFEEYQKIIQESRNAQADYTQAIQLAMQKTNDFGGSMQALKAEISKIIGEEGAARVETGLQEAATRKTNLALYGKEEVGFFEKVFAQMGAGQAGAFAPEETQALVTQDIDVKKEAATMMPVVAAAIVGGMSEPIATEIGSQIISGQGAVAETYGKLVGEMGPDEAFATAALVNQVQRGDLIGGYTAPAGAEGRGVLQQREFATQVITDFVTEGGDPVAFQAWINSIPEEKQFTLVTKLEGMSPEEQQRYIVDAGLLAQAYGDEFAQNVQSSQAYMDALAGGDTQQITDAMAAAKEAGVEQVVLDYVVRTEGASDPEDFVAKTESMTKAVQDISALPEEVVRGLNIDIKNPKDLETYGPMVEQLQGNMKIFESLDERVDLVRSMKYLTLGEDGKPLPPDQVAKNVDTLNKAWKDLAGKDKDKKLEAVRTLIMTTQDENGNTLDPDQVDAAYNELIDRFGEGKIINLPPETINRLVQFQLEVEGLNEQISFAKQEKAMIERFGGDTTDIDATITNLETMRDAAIAAQGAAVKSAPKPSSSGGGGGGQKSIGQQLKEDVEIARKIFEGLSSAVDEKGFKAFIAGPFAPEFLDYLRQQGKEGEKILKGGIQRIKEEYAKFQELRGLEIAQQATVAPFIRREQNRRLAGRGRFTESLAQEGLTTAQRDYVNEAISDEELARYNQLIALGKKRTEQQNEELRAIQRNINMAKKQSLTAVFEEQTQAFNESIRQSGESFRDFATMINTGIDPEVASTLQSLGLSIDNVSQSAIDAVKNMKLAESLRATIDGLSAMNNELKTNSLLAAAGYTGEFADELKSLGINAYSTGEQIKNTARGLMALKVMQTMTRSETEKLNISLENQNRVLQSQLEAYQRNNIKPLEDQLEAINNVIDAKQRDIEMAERRKEPYEKDIEALEEQKDKLSEVYDERIKALEKVESINARIAAQEKSQLDIASALSRGDIAGAAQAALQAQQEAAKSRIEDARAALTQQYENDQLAIEDQIKTKREEIKTIDEEINRIQGEIRGKQDEAFNKQKEINDAKKEEAKIQEKMYRLQLLQSMAQTQADIRRAAQAGDTETVGFLQQQLQSQLAIGGGDQAAQEAFFSQVEGGRGVVQASYGEFMGKTPGDIVAKAMVDILPTIDGFRNLVMQGFSLDQATDPNSSMPAALRQLVQSAYNTAEEFKNPATGLPYTVGEIVNVLGQNGALGILQPFVQNEFDQSIKNMGTMLQGVGEKMVGIGSIVDQIVEGFREIRRRINEKIESAQEAIGRLQAKITEANNTRIQAPSWNPNTQRFEAFGGMIKRAFGGMINYKGSTEQAPGMMYGGKMKKYAYGSFVPGAGMTDKVPALLTPGEFVVRKSVAAEYGPLLTALNSNVFPKMNTGGAMPKPSSNTRDGIQYNYDIDVNVAGTNASPDEIAQAVMYRIKRIDDRQVRGTKLG